MRKVKRERLFIFVKIKEKRFISHWNNETKWIMRHHPFYAEKEETGLHSRGRVDRAGSPGRCGQAPSSSVGPSLGRESHKGPVYIWVRSFASSFFLSFSFSRPLRRLLHLAALRALTLDTHDIAKLLRVCLVKRCRCATGVRDTDTRTRAKRNFLAATRSIRPSIRENIDELAREAGSVQSNLAFETYVWEKIFIFLPSCSNNNFISATRIFNF